MVDSLIDQVNWLTDQATEQLEQLIDCQFLNKQLVVGF